MDTTTLAQIHRAINVIMSDISLRGREDDLFRAGCVPRVDPQGLPGNSSLPCDLHYGSRRPEAGACQKAGSRDCQDVDALSRSAHSCAAAARRLACKHQTRAQASADSGEIRVHTCPARGPLQLSLLFLFKILVWQSD
jgi:hypothetical protein